MLLATTAAYADDPSQDYMRGYGTPFVDKTAQAFLEAWPKAKRAILDRRIDTLLFPGGKVCESPQYPNSYHADFQLSPDKGTLLVVVRLKLDAKTAKAFNTQPTKDSENAVVVAITGSTGALWSAVLDGGDCTHVQSQFAWKADGKAVVITGTTITGSRGPGALVDLRTRTLRSLVGFDKPLPSPGFLHIAGTMSFDPGLLEVDDTRVYEAKDAAITAIIWESDSVLTFCAAEPKQSAVKYRAELVPDDNPKLTKLGACGAVP